jgi:hypothetical protein
MIITVTRIDDVKIEPLKTGTEEKQKQKIHSQDEIEHCLEEKNIYHLPTDRRFTVKMR